MGNKDFSTSAWKILNMNLSSLEDDDAQELIAIGTELHESLREVASSLADKLNKERSKGSSFGAVRFEVKLTASKNARTLVGMF